MKKSIYSKKNNSGRYTALLLVLFLLIASIIVFATITLLDPFERGHHETKAPHTSASYMPKDTTGENSDTEPDLTENSVPESTAAPVVTDPPVVTEPPVVTDPPVTSPAVCQHTYGNWTETQKATCTAHGTRTRKCSKCGATESGTIAALGHKTVSDPAIAATSTKTGLTEGSHCSVCGAVITKQNTVNKTAHKPVSDPAVPATCTKTGLTEGSHCSVCGAVITKQNTVSKTAHKPVSDPAVPATCTKTGLTEGSHCSVCGTVITKQTETPAGHKYVATVVPPTSKSDGYTEYKCSVCGDTYKDNIIESTGSVGLAYRVNSDGKTCTITGLGTCTDKDIMIPKNIDGYKVTAIGDKAFADISHVTSIEIPDTVTTIGTRAFYACTGLTEFCIPESVTEIGTQIFYKASNLKTVYYYSKYWNYNNKVLDESNIERIIVSNNITSSITSNLSNLKEAIIINAEQIPRFAFSNCVNLTSVTIKNTPDGKYPCVRIGVLAFRGCYNLKNIILPDSLKRIDYNAFYGCESLYEISLPSSVLEIDIEAFVGTSSLTNIYISDLAKWCNITGGGISRYNLNLYINGQPATDIEIPYGVTSINSRMFGGFVNINSVKIPDSVRSIGEKAFYSCTSLTHVSIPDSVTTINKDAFAKCKKLSTVIIPESVEQIYDYAFQECESLTNVNIMSTKVRIEWGAFLGCTQLNEIIFHGDKSEWKSGHLTKRNLLPFVYYKIICNDGTITYR